MVSEKLEDNVVDYFSKLSLLHFSGKNVFSAFLFMGSCFCHPINTWHKEGPEMGWCQ